MKFTPTKRRLTISHLSVLEPVLKLALPSYPSFLPLLSPGLPPSWGSAIHVFLVFSWRQSVRCICTTRVFLGGKSLKRWRGYFHHVQKFVFFGNLISCISSMRILSPWCSVSSIFKTVSKKIVVTTINSWLNSTYLLISEEWRERERRERQRARINRRKAWEEDWCGKFMQHLEICLLIAKADRAQFVSSYYVLTTFLHWIYKIKYSCY